MVRSRYCKAKGKCWQAPESLGSKAPQGPFVIEELASNFPKLFLELSLGTWFLKVVRQCLAGGCNWQGTCQPLKTQPRAHLEMVPLLVPLPSSRGIPQEGHIPQISELADPTQATWVLARPPASLGPAYLDRAHFQRCPSHLWSLNPLPLCYLGAKEPGHACTHIRRSALTMPGKGCCLAPLPLPGFPTVKQPCLGTSLTEELPLSVAGSSRS